MPPRRGLRRLLDLAPVVPVVVLEDVADAVPLARALVAGGLPAIEVTLRTPAALDAIRAIAGARCRTRWSGRAPCITPEQVKESVAAGARFLVSPGWTDMLLEAMRASGVPFLPGVSTTSEVVALLERGVREMKFFPAQAAGGTAYLKSLGGAAAAGAVLSDGRDRCRERTRVPGAAQRRLCGRDLDDPRGRGRRQDWGRIEALAREAAGLRQRG